MSISNYTQPLITIEQRLQTLPEGVADRLLAIVIGPQYILSRHDKETVQKVTFDAAGQDIEHKYYDEDDVLTALPATYEVDLASVKVHVEDVEASLATFTAAGTAWTVESAANANVLVLGTNNVKGGTLNTSFRSRPVAVGDLVYVSESDSGGAVVRKRTVTALQGVDVAATKGSDADGSKDDNKPANSAYNPVTDATADATETISAPVGFTITSTGTLDVTQLGGSIVGTGKKLGEEFTITVVQTATQATKTDGLVNITSKSGLYSATNVATADGTGTLFDITSAALAGLTKVTIDGGGADVVAGQVYRIRVYQAYERLTAGVAVADDDLPAEVDIGVYGTYTGPSDTTYIVKVVEGTAAGSGIDQAVLEVSDTKGLEEVTEVTVSVGAATDPFAFALGSYGLTFILKFDGASDPAQDSLRAGDVYYIHAVAATESTSEFDKVVLSGPAVDSLTWNFSSSPKVEFRLAHSGEVASDDAGSGDAWTATSTEITINPSLSVYVSERADGYKWVALADGVGKVIPSFRALVPPTATENKILIETVSDITDELGTVDLENDLAFGVNEALTGAAGKHVYALRTAGTDLADYTAALAKLESTDGIYALAPLTTNLTIQAAVATHCESMSAKAVKNFRRCYVATDSPGRYAVLTDTTAYVTEYAGENLLVVTDDEDADFTTLGLEAGDVVKLIISGGEFTEFELSEVLSDTELLLVSGPASPIAAETPVALELWREDTASSQVDYIVARSESLASRRCANVWVENGKRYIDDVLTTIPNKYVAAYIAGLRTSVLPWQGLTMTEVSTITQASAMYTRYSTAQLNTIAAAGTFVITQDAENGDVFIRHQLTTKTDSGSLYYEDSIGVNLDDISFKVKDILKGYVGKKNVTPQTIREIDSEIWTLLTEATQVDAGVDYGPQLINFKDKDGELQKVTVAAHPTLKDRIEVYGILDMPLPLNHLEVILEASVDFTL